MEVVFLNAKKSLAKEISIDGTKPYPLVKNFTSEHFDISVDKIKEANLDVFTLSNYDNLLSQAVKKQYINDDEFNALKEWSLSPSTWNIEVE